MKVLFFFLEKWQSSASSPILLLDTRESIPPDKNAKEQFKCLVQRYKTWPGPRLQNLNSHCGDWAINNAIIAMTNYDISYENWLPWTSLEAAHLDIHIYVDIVLQGICWLVTERNKHDCYDNSLKCNNIILSTHFSGPSWRDGVKHRWKKERWERSDLTWPQNAKTYTRQRNGDVRLYRRCPRR